MNLATIMSAIQLAGSTLPAFKALLDAALPLLAPVDQATAKAAYADIMRRSDDAHAALQAQD